MSAEPVAINGNEVYVQWVEKPGFVRAGFDLGEWRGLRLYVGQRVPVRRGEGSDEWLYVTKVTELDAAAWVEFRKRYDGPVESPPRPLPRLVRPAPRAAEVTDPSPKYEGQVIRFPAAAVDTPPHAVAGQAEDAHGRLLTAGREWLERYKPRARYAVFLNDEGDDAPMGRVTIRPTDGGGAA